MSSKRIAKNIQKEKRHSAKKSIGIKNAIQTYSFLPLPDNFKIDPDIYFIEATDDTPINDLRTIIGRRY